MRFKSERRDHMKQTHCGANPNIIRQKISCCTKHCKHLSPTVSCPVINAHFFPILKQMNVCWLIRGVKQQAGSTAQQHMAFGF